MSTIYLLLYDHYEPHPAEVNEDFYERLANLPHWRERCADCRCPKWAHAAPHPKVNITVTACTCGRCNFFKSKTRANKQR